MLSERLRRLKDRLGRFRFWFSYKLPKEGGRWPIRSDEYAENLLPVQNPSWYNLYFNDLTKKRAITEKDFADDLVRLFAQGSFNTQCSSAPYFNQAVSLIANGFTTSTMLGKLRATELNLSAERNRLYSWLGSRRKENESDLQADICQAEHVCTPQEFATLLKFEMLVRNPKLIEKEVQGVDILAYDNQALFGPADIAGLYPLKNASTAISDQTLEGILDGLRATLGIKFTPNKKLANGSVSLYRIKRFAATKEAIRNFKNRLLKRYPKTIAKGVYSLEYPDNASLSNADKLYTILKALCNKSMENYLPKCRSLVFDKFQAVNLPSQTDFDLNLPYIKNASACLVASDICLMLLGKTDPKTANLMRDCFRIEAGQNINMLHGETKNNFMPMIADYYAESVNSFAKDFGITKEELAEYKSVSLKHLDEEEAKKNNIAHALYATEKPRSYTYMGEHMEVEDVLKLNKATGQNILDQLKEAAEQKGLNNSSKRKDGELGPDIQQAAEQVKNQANDNDNSKQFSKQEIDSAFEGTKKQAADSQIDNSKSWGGSDVYISKPLSMVAKSVMKKVSSTGELVDLTEKDELRLLKRTNELGQIEGGFLLNGAKVDCDMSEESKPLDSSQLKNVLPPNSIYVPTPCVMVGIDTPNGVLIKYKNQNDLDNVRKETISLYDEKLGVMYTFIGDNEKKENHCSYTTTMPTKYFVNNVECSEENWKSIVGFLEIQSQRANVAKAIEKNITPACTIKDNIPVTKEAKEAANTVLFGGIYCTQQQKDLVEKYCRTVEATPLLVQQEKEDDEVNELDVAQNEPAQALVESRCALRWFKKMHPKTNSLIPIGPNMKLLLVDNDGELETYIKDKKEIFARCNKYDLYVGNKLRASGVVAPHGVSVQFGDDPKLIIKEQGINAEVSLNQENETIEFLRTTDVLEREGDKYYINGKQIDSKQYTKLFDLLDLHDNFHMVKNEGKKQGKQINHHWGNEKKGHPATVDGMWDLNTINFDGIYCSPEERLLYLRYGSSERIKDSLRVAGAKDRNSDANKKTSKVEVSRNKLEKEVRAKTIVLYDKMLEGELDICLENARLLGNKATVAGQQHLLYADLIKAIIREDTDKLDGSKEANVIKAQACSEKLTEIERVVDVFMKIYDKRKTKYVGQTIDDITDMLVTPEGKTSAVIEKSVLSLIDKYKKVYAETAERERITEKINSRKNDDNFKIDAMTTKALEKYWRNLEKPPINRKEFLSTLKDGELPQATKERDLEKVQGQSIVWFNRLLASVMEDYVKSNLVNQYKSLRKKLFCKGNKNKGVIWYEEYDEAILDLVAQKRLAEGVKECLLNPLTKPESNTKRGAGYEVDAWNDVRDWTNGVAEAVIKFYADNKDIYTEQDKSGGQPQKITRVLCEDYVQKVGGLKKLKSYLRRQVASIMQDKERNKMYAQELGIDIKGINPSAPLAN